MDGVLRIAHDLAIEDERRREAFRRKTAEAIWRAIAKRWRDGDPALVALHGPCPLPPEPTR